MSFIQHKSVCRLRNMLDSRHPNVRLYVTLRRSSRDKYFGDSIPQIEGERRRRENEDGAEWGGRGVLSPTV